MLKAKFKPWWYQKSVFDINYDLLKKKKIRLLIFDLDNTIAFVHEKKASDEIIKLFHELSKKFEGIIVASNSFKKRVTLFCEDLECNSFGTMLKPSKKIYRSILKDLGIKMDEICIIGDQLMTDILLGNRLGIKTILVDPLGEKDLIVTNFNRFLEGKILKKINIKRGMYYEEE